MLAPRDAVEICRPCGGKLLSKISGWDKQRNLLHPEAGRSISLRNTCKFVPFCMSSMSRDSSVGITTRCGPDGPGFESRWEASISSPVQTAHGVYQASYTMGTGSVPGIKRPERGVDHPLPSSAEVKERVELYLYPPLGLRGLF